MPEKESTSPYRWFADELVWKRRKGRAKTWTAENPPMPDWAQASGGGVEPARFVRLYAAADSLSTLKSQLFWLSLGEIEAMRIGISQWLSEHDIQPLAPLAGSGAVLEEADLSALLAEGVLSAVAAEVPAAEEPAAEESSAEESDEDIDLTPLPPRPNEDPLLNKTFNEIMHMPEAKDERQMVTMMGMGKGLRITGKH